MQVKSIIAIVLSSALLADAAVLGRRSHTRFHKRQNQIWRREPQVLSNPTPAKRSPQATSDGTTNPSYNAGSLDLNSGTSSNYIEQNGSIYLYHDAAKARNAFWTAGSCGLSTYFASSVPAGMPLVAMPATVMGGYGASQHNSLCGRTITIEGPNGVCATAIVADTNVSDDHSIDMDLSLWEKFGGKDGDGTLLKCQWRLEPRQGGQPHQGEQQGQDQQPQPQQQQPQW